LPLWEGTRVVTTVHSSYEKGHPEVTKSHYDSTLRKNGNMIFAGIKRTKTEAPRKGSVLNGVKRTKHYDKKGVIRKDRT